MADGSPYFDPYGGVETSGGMIPPLGVYRQGEGYDGSSTDHKPSGYYSDHYSHLPSQADGHSLNPPPAHGLPAVDSMPGVVPSSGHEYSPIPGMLTSSAGMPGMYDGITNYSLKSEHRQHMPLTPPGSPDDPTDLTLHGGLVGPGMGAPQSLMADPLSATHHLLAKPVPMRRLSEKRIAQARANFGSVSASIQSDTMDGTMLGPTNAVAHAIAMTQQTPRRPRSEKKPIPEDLKDDRYFERRKRNNNAAKKSRDARKSREDEIAIRASFLEKENAILRAQVATLREEANSLRQLLLQKRSRP